MLRDRFRIKSGNHVTRAGIIRFFEKYQIILYMFLCWWVYGILLIFATGAAKLKYWNDFHFFAFQCTSFLPLFIIGFFELFF